MCAYLIQVFSVCVFGVLVSILFLLFTSFSSKLGIREIAPFRKIQKRVHEINAFFSISILLAAIIRWREVPSLMETVMISYIVWFQFIICCTMLFMQLCDHMKNAAIMPWFYQPFYLTIIVAQLVASCVIDVPNEDVYKDLATQCHEQYNFIDLSRWLFGKGTFTLKWTLVGMVIGLVFIGLTAAFAGVLLKLVPAWIKKHGEVIFFVAVLSLDISSVVSNVVLMMMARGDLKKLSQYSLPQNDWGYGQTTALLLWAFVFWTWLYESFRTYYVFNQFTSH